MKGLWKRTKQLLRMKDADVGPSLRKKLLAVNGALIALFLSSIWMRCGYPLPTMEMEFRRLERTHLMPRSEIVFQTGKRYQTLPLAAEGPKVQLRDRWVVGLWEGGATVLAEEQYRSGRSPRSFYPIPRGDGPCLVPLLREGKFLEEVGRWTRSWDTGQSLTYEFVPFLLLDAPAETARAELTIRFQDEGHTGGGWLLEDGNWLLHLEISGAGRIAPRYAETAYDLALYRADGSLLLEKSGMLGEG